jgi:RNA polymerase sigma-70 factor (ECF subfamily)
MNKAINLRKQGGMLSKLREVFSIDREGKGGSGTLAAPDQWRPDRQYQRKQAEIELTELLGRLPQRQREVYLLHKLEGLSYREIAAELNLTLSSVESLIHRAKVNLQKVMLKSFRKRGASESPTGLSNKRMEEESG